MAKKETQRQQSARVALLSKEPSPSLERINKIKQWHIDQAIADTKPVATLNLSITACGRIITQGVCIEEEHAQVFLGELHAVITRIQSQLRPSEPVVKLVRSA
jgi:hypothetical protein